MLLLVLLSFLCCVDCFVSFLFIEVLGVCVVVCCCLFVVVLSLVFAFVVGLSCFNLFLILFSRFCFFLYLGVCAFWFLGVAGRTVQPPNGAPLLQGLFFCLAVVTSFFIIVFVGWRLFVIFELLLPGCCSSFCFFVGGAI